MQQHQGQQAQSLGFVDEFDHQPAQPDRLGAEVAPRQARPVGGRVALVEDQVDHLQHALGPRRQLRAARDLIGNGAITDPRLRPDDALGDGRRGRQIGPRDLLGGQSAHFPEGQGDAGVRSQRRVAAGEDQPQFVVLDGFGHGRLRRRFGQRHEVGQGPRQARLPAPAIDGLEAARGHQPGIGIGRHAMDRPLLGRGGERLVRGFLRRVEAAKQAD